MRIVSVVGARPQFVKLAPVSRAMADRSVIGQRRVEDIIVHTGQHYDRGMSDVFFDELDIPKPSIELAVGSGSHGVQTARMLESLESTFVDVKPDKVVVYGDTNSTVAAALAAAKLNIPIAHVEAGLRSFNRTMPEEINRIVADHVSDQLFAPTQSAMNNLETEDLARRSVNTGDVMLDAVTFNAAIAEARSDVLARVGTGDLAFGVTTIHRPVNTDTDNLISLLSLLNELSTRYMPIVFPMHPRTASILKEKHPRWRPDDRLIIVDPVGYLDMLMLVKQASVVLTDSGGLQKEALFLGTPCVTLREESEWPETVEVGANVLTGADSERIASAVEHWNELAFEVPNEGAAAFGDGQAAAAIVRELLRN